MAESSDIIVVSDLHLGRGKNPKTGRYYRLEAFFYDEDFKSFCQYLIDEARLRHAQLKLIFNGDTFDLLRIDHERDPDQKRRERRYGPLLTPAVAAETMQQILAGHPTFIAALATFLAAGHEVIFLPGNHDLEMQWPTVQDVVRQALLKELREAHGEEAGGRTEELLKFREWFYYEPGRIWIEHGCQYDQENAFRYFLRGELDGETEAVHKSEVDLPLGTFFQKYLYNKFGNITFIVPTSRSNLRYFRWLILNRPRLLARLATVHFPFLLQILRRIAKAGQRVPAELKSSHEKSLARLAKSSGLGEKLEEIEAYKQVAGSSALIARQVIIRLIKIAGFGFLGALLVIALWTLGVHSIGTTHLGVGLKALLFLAFNFLFVTVSVAVVLYLLLRPGGAGPDPWVSRTASRIAQLLDVPIVTFGHTHEEDLGPVALGASDAWYYNTGTWIAVFTADTLLPRERVQYTFLRVRDKEAELLHWSPGRSQATPVVLIEDAPVQILDEGVSD